MSDLTAHAQPAGDQVAAGSAVPRTGPGTGQPTALAAASVLAHPARRRIAETLGGAPHGLTVAELVSQVGGLHHNAIRNHLRVLARAGLVAVERNPPHGRGRPTERFVLVDPEASRIAAQQLLARLLVAMVVEAGIDDDRAHAFGAAHGPEVVSGVARTQLLGSLARLGFAPHETTSVKDAATGVLEIRLEHCPFADAVLAPGGTIVCAMHRGLLDGAAAASGTAVRITRFDVHHARDAGCIVRFDGVDPLTPAPAASRRPRPLTSPAR